MATKRIKLKDRTLENDIKYGGVLSYRHLRIIGWLCMIIGQVGVILNLEVKLAPETASAIEIWTLVTSAFASMAVPIFLLANFSTMLQQRGNFKALFVRYGVLAAGMYILANFIVFHFGFRTMHAFAPETTWGDAARVFGILLPSLGKTGYTLNIFIDMLLVVCMFFFANYQPNSKIFAGKRVLIFRFLILLPIGYEVACILLKYYAGMQVIEIPSPVFFLMTSKPPLIVAALLVVIFGLKLGQIAHKRRHGQSEEAYIEHTQTKAHSLKVSIIIAVIFFIFGILDIIVYLGATIYALGRVEALYPGATEEEMLVLVFQRLSVYEGIGIGSSAGLILIAPLVLLFSYSKTHKNPKIDTFIPIAGIGLMVLVLVEGIFQVLTLNISAFVTKLNEYLDQIINDGEPSNPASLIADWAKGLIDCIRLL